MLAEVEHELSTTGNYHGIRLFATHVRDDMRRRFADVCWSNDQLKGCTVLDPRYKYLSKVDKLFECGHYISYYISTKVVLRVHLSAYTDLVTGAFAFVISHFQFSKGCLQLAESYSKLANSRLL